MSTALFITAQTVSKPHVRRVRGVDVVCPHEKRGLCSERVDTDVSHDAVSRRCAA